MGVAIGFLWFGSVAVLVALFRQKFDSPAWGWLLRLGMLDHSNRIGRRRIDDPNDAGAVRGAAYNPQS